MGREHTAASEVTMGIAEGTLSQHPIPLQLYMDAIRLNPSL